MKFPLVEYHNFGPFVNVAFGLDARGLVLVQGNNTVSTSADSNGSGKSFMVEGIPWTLFGKTIRGLTGDDVVNNSAKRDCLGHITVDADGQMIDIYRHRKVKAKNGLPKLPDGKDIPTGSGLLFYVDGNDMTLGTVKETEAAIVDLLGLDYEAFIRSIYFDGHSVPAFPTLTDKEIKAVFERLLGLEEFQKVAAVVKARKTTVENAIAGIDSQMKLAQSELSTAQLEAQTAISRIGQFDTERDNQVAAIARQITDERTHAGASDFDLQRSNEKSIQDGLNEKISKLNAVDAMLEKWTADNQAAHQVMYRAAEVEGGLEDQYKNFRGKADNAEQMIGQPCGECGKHYEAGDLNHIIEHNMKAATDTHAQIATAAKNTRIAEKVVSDLTYQKAKLDLVVQSRSDASESLRESHTRSQAVDVAESAYRRLEGILEARQTDIDTLKAKPNPYIEDQTRWETKAVEMQSRFDSLQADMETKFSDLKVIDLLTLAYGRQGLKTHILETVTPMLNEKANEYACRLSDGQVEIEFSTFKTNKDGSKTERFSVNVTNAQGAELYLGNSTGERKKIDLAIALAMSDLVAARSAKAVDLWVADEIAESLDPTALERVVDILNEKAVERGSLFTISHVDLSEHIPQVVTVKKTAAGSILI